MLTEDELLYQYILMKRLELDCCHKFSEIANSLEKNLDPGSFGRSREILDEPYKISSEEVNRIEVSLFSPWKRDLARG